MNNQTAENGGASDPEIMARAFAGIIGGEEFASVVHDGSFEFEPRFRNLNGSVSAFMAFLTPSPDGGLHAVKFEFRPSDFVDEVGDGPETSWIEIESMVARFQEVKGMQMRAPRCFERAEVLLHRMEDSIRDSLRDPETAGTILGTDYIAGRLMAIKETAAKARIDIFPSMTLDMDLAA